MHLKDLKILGRSIADDFLFRGFRLTRRPKNLKEIVVQIINKALILKPLKQMDIGFEFSVFLHILESVNSRSAECAVDP